MLIVGLALHNLVLAQLWHAGLRGGALSAVAAWKDVLLVGALAAVALGAPRPAARSRSPPTGWRWPTPPSSCCTALIPQSWLGGGATHKGVVFAARHDLLPVGGVPPRPRARPDRRGALATLPDGSVHCGRRRRLRPRRRLSRAAVVVAPQRHRRVVQGSARPRLLGPLSGLPENFVYNAGGDEVFRRLTSTFLSPLATGYLLVVALFHVPLRRRYGPPRRAAAVRGAALDAHPRRAARARARPARASPCCAGAPGRSCSPSLVAVVGLAFVKEYTHFGPRTHFTPSELHDQEQHAKTSGPASNDATSANDASTSEHLASLRDGIRTVLHHPWGFGLGNAGVTASRTHVTVQGGRVDLHRARRRDRACSAACCSSRGRSRCSAGSRGCRGWPRPSRSCSRSACRPT